MTKESVIRFIASLPPGEFRWIIGASRKAWAAKNGKPVRRLRLKLDAKDLRWAHDVKDRDGWACRRCGAGKITGTRLEAAHIVPRRYKATRHLLDNGITLCASHHRWAHEDLSVFMAWVREEVEPAVLDRLQELTPSWKGWTK